LAAPSNPEIMMSTILPVFESDELFWPFVEDLRLRGMKIPALPSQRAWDAAGKASENVMRVGRLVFQQTARSDSLFTLILEPLSSQPTSNRFFRHFGAHRFLRLLLPSLERPPSYLNASRESLHSRVQEWLNKGNKDFMGCKWSVFHTRMRRPRKSKTKRSNEEESGHEVMLFATEGLGMQRIPVFELIDWFLPLTPNGKQPSCKAFARIELGTVFGFRRRSPRHQDRFVRKH